MPCTGYCSGELLTELIKTEGFKARVMEGILIGLSYENVSTGLIPGENERLIIGEYKEKLKNRKITLSVCIGYIAKNGIEKVEISAIERERAEKIEAEINKMFPEMIIKKMVPNKKYP